MSESKIIQLDADFINVGTDYSPVLFNREFFRKEVVHIEQFTYDSSVLVLRNGKEIHLRIRVDSLRDALIPTVETEDDDTEE